eukprot:9497740-Karenia_brevis.AAC.1
MEVDCLDLSILLHNAQVKIPLQQIKHYLAPEPLEDVFLNVIRNGFEYKLKARYNSIKFKFLYFAILPKGVPKDIAPR